jgi:hypothetical protein
MPISARKEILKESYRNLPKHRHSQRGFLSFLAIAVMVSTAFGLDNNPTNQEAVLLWEKDFGEEVVDVIFDEAEMTVEEARALGFKGLEQREATDTVVVQYPKVLMIKDENAKHEPLVKSIKFLDEKGSVKKEVPLQRYIPDKQSPARINIAKNRQYIRINTPIKEDEHGDLVEAESVILDTAGNVLWSIKHNLSIVYLSPDGKYIVGVPTLDWSDAPIYVYNEKGLVKEIKKNTSWWDIDFSADGSYFAVTIKTY